MCAVSSLLSSPSQAVKRRNVSHTGVDDLELSLPSADRMAATRRSDSRRLLALLQALPPSSLLVPPSSLPPKDAALALGLMTVLTGSELEAAR